jgi:hypothetical protein
MLSVIPMSPYCAREAIGGTSVEPRTVVGNGDAVGDGATLGERVVAGGVGLLVLAGVTQAPTASEAAASSAAGLMTQFSRTEQLLRIADRS